MNDLIVQNFDRFLARPHMIWATLAYVILLVGLSLRKKNRLLHGRLMGFAIFLDLALVLLLQIERNAIDTAVNLRLTPLQMCHVLSSTIATVLYFPTLYFGFKCLRQIGSPTADRPMLRKKHLRFAVPAFIFRTIGFLFMFSLLPKD
ncbi:MAG TPA: hypothetical protein PLH57_04720 [Oligoflexia bacterium]|nr:hypothetical protein [Oligoflexia bacterium]